MILTGLARLGRDAELRFTQDNTPVVTMALAYNIGFGDKQKTQWVEASFWGERAQKVAPYLLKGGLVSVILSDVLVEEYQHNGKSGVKLKGRVSDLEFAGAKQDGQQSAQQTPRQQPAQKPQQQSYGSAFDDGDIPF